MWDNQEIGPSCLYLDFSKAFDAVTHSILLGMLAAHGLERYILCCKELAGEPGPEWN